MMRRTGMRIAGLMVAAAGVVVASIAIADAPKEGAAAPEMQLPPGWTPEDMQKCMLAGTPGKMHEYLTKGAGRWPGKTTMWMAPGMDPMTGECVTTVTPMMDGRYVQVEMKGEMPGMGMFHGLGIYGYDNVSQEFVATWIDNQGTGIAFGNGKLSEDGKTLKWKIGYNCPVTGKPTVLREVETITGKDTKTLEMYGMDPKSGKEFKMMVIEMKREASGE